MVEQVIMWVEWAVQKVWPGLVLALALKSVSHTEFYEKHLAHSVSVIERYLFGPRLRICFLGQQERESIQDGFSILRLEIINQPNVTHIPLLNWKLPDAVRERVNFVIPCKPLINARVCRRFFNKHWELMPDTRRSGLALQSRLDDHVCKLPPREKSAVDVAGLSGEGDCYGTRTNIGKRWGMHGTGNPQIDLPLVAGDDYYVEVSVGDDQTRITYAVSYFVIKNQGNVDTFELLPATPPSWIPKVKYGCD